MNDTLFVQTAALIQFVTDVLTRHGLSAEDAAITADVLVAADRRGIESHGVARLKRYVDGLHDGTIRPDAPLQVVRETPVSLVIDGGGGMGQPVAYRTMQRCIAKARDNMLCFAAVRNSNHYGIAGYYTLMALAENMIGISLTNSAPLVVPTFGKEVVIGTNPISIGIPARNERPFLLDMATSTVPRGKVEVYARADKTMPDCWATDETGLPSTDAAQVIRNLLARAGGGLLPLGGGTELTGGHKGYGLAAVVDILCAVLSSGSFSLNVYGDAGALAQVAHFLGVINPEAFVGLEAIRQNLDAFIRMLRQAPRADGQERIYIAGEKEFEAEERHRARLPLATNVFTALNQLGEPLALRLNVYS